MPKNIFLYLCDYLFFLSVILVRRKKPCDRIEDPVVQAIEHSLSKAYKVNDSIGYGQISSYLPVDVLGKGIGLFPILKRTGKGIQDLLFPVIQKNGKFSVFGYIGFYKSRIDGFKPVLTV